MHILVDIETAPRANAGLFLPAVEPFDPSTVKYGNIKDAQLRADKLRSEAESHSEAQRTRREKFLEKAALSPLTGQIVAIGASNVYGDKVFFNHLADGMVWRTEQEALLGQTIESNDESSLLTMFDRWLRDTFPKDNTREWRLVSWSGAKRSGNFDADFLRRRLMANNVFTHCMSQATWIDAASLYLRESSWETFLSLKNACLEMGIVSRYGGACTGAIFDSHYRSHPEDAMEYLRGDVEDLRQVWQRLTLVNPSLTEWDEN